MLTICSHHRRRVALQDLASCCNNGEKGEIHDGLEVMLSVPRRANDALHLSMMVNHETIADQGDVVLQNSFQVTRRCSQELF